MMSNKNNERISVLVFLFHSWMKFRTEKENKVKRDLRTILVQEHLLGEDMSLNVECL